MTTDLLTPISTAEVTIGLLPGKTFATEDEASAAAREELRVRAVAAVLAKGRVFTTERAARRQAAAWLDVFDAVGVADVDPRASAAELHADVERLEPERQPFTGPKRRAKAETSP